MHSPQTSYELENCTNIQVKRISAVSSDLILFPVHKKINSSVLQIFTEWLLSWESRCQVKRPQVSSFPKPLWVTCYFEEAHESGEIEAHAW